MLYQSFLHWYAFLDRQFLGPPDSGCSRKPAYGGRTVVSLNPRTARLENPHGKAY